MTHTQLIAVEKFADQVREQFPLTNDTENYTEEIKQVFYQHVWDIVAILEKNARLEANFEAEKEALEAR